MPGLTWIALLFFLLALGFGAFHAVREAIRLFRTFGSSTSRLSHAIEGVAASADEISRRLERLPDKGERLTADLERFSQSRAELGFLLSRFAEVRRTVKDLRAVALGK